MTSLALIFTIQKALVKIIFWAYFFICEPQQDFDYEVIAALEHLKFNIPNFSQLLLMTLVRSEPRDAKTVTSHSCQILIYSVRDILDNKDVLFQKTVAYSMWGLMSAL